MDTFFLYFLPASHFRRGLASRFRFSICPILLHGSRTPPAFRLLPYPSSSMAASHFPASWFQNPASFPLLAWSNFPLQVSDLSDPAFRCLLFASGFIWFHVSSIPPASRFRRCLASRFRFPICPIRFHGFRFQSASGAFYLLLVLSSFMVPEPCQLPGSCLICQPAWRHPTSRLHGLRILPASRLPESCQLPAFGVV